MNHFTIHVQKHGVDPEPDIRAVKEGFNWAAFVFNGFWALIKGYWWAMAGIFLVSLGISWAMGLFGLDLFGQAVVNIGFNLLVGLYANDLARWTLSRRGFVEEDVIYAQNRDHAVESYLRSLHTI